jgi:hypothetical protein
MGASELRDTLAMQTSITSDGNQTEPVMVTKLATDGTAAPTSSDISARPPTC